MTIFQRTVLIVTLRFQPKISSLQATSEVLSIYLRSMCLLTTQAFLSTKALRSTSNMTNSSKIVVESVLLFASSRLREVECGACTPTSLGALTRKHTAHKATPSSSSYKTVLSPSSSTRGVKDGMRPTTLIMKFSVCTAVLRQSAQTARLQMLS